MESKLIASETEKQRLQNEYISLRSKLKKKDHAILLAEAENTMNKKTVKKFAEEEKKYRSLRSFLLSQYVKGEKAWSYRRYKRDCAKHSAHEAAQRAKEGDLHVRQLEQKVKELNDDLLLFKHACKNSKIDSVSEEELLDSVLAPLCSEDCETSARAFLDENNGPNESYTKLLHMWENLRPSTKRVLSIVAKRKELEKDEKNISLNLHGAENEELRDQRSNGEED